jgi:hypothetical protein
VEEVVAAVALALVLLEVLEEVVRYLKEHLELAVLEPLIKVMQGELLMQVVLPHLEVGVRVKLALGLLALILMVEVVMVLLPQ